MNNATVFALTSTIGALTLIAGFVIGRLSVPPPAEPPKDPGVREIIKEVPVVREVVREVAAPPDATVIAAAVEVRLAALRASAKEQFWSQVKARFDQLRRRAIVDAVRATNSQAARYQEFQRELAYKDEINLVDVVTGLYHLLQRPDLEFPVEHLVKEALEYAISAQDEAHRRGY